jgi:glycine cleavage system H protein
MKFTKEHEWLKADGEIITVGITEYASTELGDVVYVELPEVGRAVSRGDDIVVIESVKAASDIVAPVEGEIVEVNEEVADNPAIVNEDPMGAAWIFKIKVADPTVIDEYLDEDAYNTLIE